MIRTLLPDTVLDDSFCLMAPVDIYCIVRRSCRSIVGIYCIVRSLVSIVSVVGVVGRYILCRTNTVDLVGQFVSINGVVIIIIISI